MSDNWNLLAKLLGTPQPPQPKEEKKSPANNESNQDQHGTGDSSNATDQQNDEIRSLPPVAEAAVEMDMETQPDAGSLENAESSSDDLSANEVLDALTSEATVAQLPGFGLQEKDPDIEELAAGGPPAIDEPIVEELLENEATPSASDELFDQSDEPDDQAWDALAGELGIDAADAPAPHRQPVNVEHRQSREASKPKRPRRAFGDGLGIDLGPESDDHNDDESVEEPVSEVEVERASDSIESTPTMEDTTEDSEFDPLDPLSFRSFRDLPDENGGTDEDSESNQDAITSPAPSTRRRERNQDEKTRSSRRDADESADTEDERRNSPSRTAGSRYSEEGRGERRPRRGRRGQRQRMADENSESDSFDAAIEDLEKEERPFGEVQDDSEDRSPARRRRRGRGRREVAEPNVDSFEDDDILEVDFESDDEEDSDEESTDRKKRRRGRRRRGRRRRESEVSQEESSSDSEDDLDDRLESESEFDDDHEDDDEVEAIRRGRRRRGRRGRRVERESETGDREASDDLVRKSRSRRSPRDDQDSGSEEPARRRKPVPTWNEVVSILVDSNVENHKKPSKGKGRGKRR